MRTTQDAVTHIRAEYLEMPGMRLTFPQLQRLCGMEPALCKAALESLVATKFLCVTADGAYARLTDGEFPRTSPVKGDLTKATTPHESRHTLTTSESCRLPQRSAPPRERH
jgi:hypothetical protein